MKASSMSVELTGSEVDCTTKTSRPRTFAPTRTWLSPSDERMGRQEEEGRPMMPAISSASSSPPVPHKITTSSRSHRWIRVALGAAM
jgi:hypothetical protein